MEQKRYASYTLEEAAQLTGYAQPTLRRAIEAVDLVFTSSDQGGESRISGIELERWWYSVEGRETDLFSTQVYG